MSTVRVSGPLFDGRAQHEITEFRHEAVKQVGDQAYSEVMGNLNTSIRHPTPYYETQIQTTHEEGRATVDDRGIIYGPWLEGTGSRNKTTRFKGYWSFKRATAAVVEQLPESLKRLLKPYLERMNHG